MRATNRRSDPTTRRSAFRAEALLLLLLSGCCASLPRLPAKRLVLGESRSGEVTVSRETFHDAKRSRDVPVTIYAPAGAHERLPVVLFSHGIGEDRDSYAWIGEALAAHGYLAVHITHAGTDKAVLQRGYRYLYRAVKQKENWVNRPLDASFVLDQLATRADVDMTHVAIAGHSAGAFTAFALAGMRLGEGDSFRDPRVRVAVAMSMPRMDKIVPPGGYDAVAIPLLNVTGTCDTSLIYRTFPRHRRIPFEQTHAHDQYLVTLKRVNHDTFSAQRGPHHARIAALTLAFLDAFLRDDAAARAWFREAGSASDLTVEAKP